jgi:putative glutamine amidotransferase
MPSYNDPSFDAPWVLVPACSRALGDHAFHVVGDKYLAAVRLAGGLPLVMPTGARETSEPLMTQPCHSTLTVMR